MRILLPLLVVLCWSGSTHTQPDDATLSAFRGTIYGVPRYYETKGFSEGLAPFDSIGFIVLPRLNFTPDWPYVHFPDRGLKDRFAFTLRGDLTVTTPGCYEITLASDDGALLWINDSLTIDNGGMHTWRVAKDSVPLAGKSYALDVWYYNAVGPSGLGLKFNRIDSIYCTTPRTERIACLTFPTDSYRLRPEHRLAITAFMNGLGPQETISVTGYADPTGSRGYNRQLSLRRARAVETYLADELGLAAARIRAVGVGEVERVAEGGCETSRAVVVRVGDRFD